MWSQNIRYGTLNNNYIYGNGKKLARKDGAGTVNYLHSDYLSSLRVITNSSDTAVWNRNFYPFGEETYAYSIGNEYKFTGKEWDEEKSAYHFQYRDYSPDYGSWRSPDPSWLLRPELSPYVYCGNNPLKYVDLLGLEELTPQEPIDGHPNYLLDEPLIVTPSSWKDEMRRYMRNWFNNQYPVASNDDSWFYKMLRGTGDMQQDLRSFTIGTMSIPFIVGAATFGAITYGPAVLAITQEYAAILQAMGLASQQQVYAWVTTVGYDKALVFLSNVSQAALRLYLPNKIQIDKFIEMGIKGWGIPTPNKVTDWIGFSGWLAGKGINYIYEGYRK